MGELIDALISRLRREMHRVGLNARQLSDKANVGRSFVYDILNGKSANPTTNKIAAIAQALGVSIPYLLSGVSNDNDIKNHKNGEYIAVPELVVTLQTTSQTMPTIHYFHKDWIEYLGVTSPNILRVSAINSESMAPMLLQKDAVLLDISQNKPHPPGVFLINDSIGAIPKRLEYVAGSDNKVRVISDNPQFASYDCCLSKLNIIGRVVWFSRAM